MRSTIPHTTWQWLPKYRRDVEPACYWRVNPPAQKQIKPSGGISATRWLLFVFPAEWRRQLLTQLHASLIVLELIFQNTLW
ncbi:MAG: hypothetical protein U1F42_09945 [Candidatus Competibacteraceae bacterium]